MRFLDANSGGGSGGGGSAASGASGGGQNGNGGGEQPLDIALFDSLPWDELDDDTKSALTKIKAGAVATVQSTEKLRKELNETTAVARRFQSETDRLKKATAPKTDPKSDPYVDVIKSELANAGYSAEDAEKLSPVFAGMFKQVGEIERKRLGTDLAPMAETVLATQATDAYGAALHNDPLGMLQIPEVAQVVWDMVRQRVSDQQPTTPDVVLNLAKMAWADHQAVSQHGRPAATGGGNEGGARMILPSAPPNLAFHTGGGSFGGGAPVFPAVHRAPDPSAARNSLNSDTANALATSFRTMLRETPNIKPDILKSGK